MRDSAVNKLHRDLDNKKEIGRGPPPPQSLALLELVALGNARGRILENGDVPALRNEMYRKLQAPKN